MACGDHGTNPSPHIRFLINFNTGFHEDSIIVSLDGKQIINHLVSSDVGHGPDEWIAGTYAGLHQFQLEVPLEGASADTGFWVVPGYRPTIYAHLDRDRKLITYEISTQEWPQ